MPTSLLIEGKCSIWKNRTYQDGYHSNFMHDTDVGVFKIVSGGTILFTFKASDIVSWNKGTSGIINKKLVTSISVKFQNSDEYVFEFESRDQGSYLRAKQAIGKAIQTDLAYSEILRALKLKERVSIQEVCKILTRFNMPNSFEDGKNVIEFFIASDKIAGTFDGKDFVSKLALERESVRYEIVAKFEMTSNGSFVLKCPGCGASLPLNNKKESTGKCTYCGSTYVVPKRLLDLI